MKNTKPQKIKAVLFDLDNTLIDFMRTKRLSCEAAISAMRDAGLNMNHDEAMRSLFKLYDEYGLEYQKIFQVFLKKITGRIDYRIMAPGIVAYRKVKDGWMQPYPRTGYVLDELRKRGYKLGILSDAPKIQAWVRLALIKLHDKFDVVVTFDDTKTKKPGKKPFLVAAKKLRLKPDEIMFVGDSLKRDVIGANKVGMKTVFAMYGRGMWKEKTDVKPDYAIKNIEDLLKILK